MGGADAVPGVSGGTIALILGIYERFIEALSAVVQTPVLFRSEKGRDQIKGALYFLVPLGIGLLIAYYLATKLLVGPEQTPGILRRPDTAPACYAFFFGLVLVSLREPWRRIEAPGAGHWLNAAIGCAAGAAFAHLPHYGAAPPTWLLLFGGAGAIAIMLLPGVSGSLFLVIIGQYATVAGAVHDRDVTVIAVFAAGLVLGVVSFVPFLKLLLRRYHDGTMATLTGLMAGSLFAVWPWKDNYESKAGPMTNIAPSTDHVVYVVAALVAGGAVVWVLARLERRLVTPRA
jgi:putative membrane protein